VSAARDHHCALFSLPLDSRQKCDHAAFIVQNVDDAFVCYQKAIEPP